ncbi:MAG TPA: diguanylate cyclase [Mycobacteriales bacterium]|jgi:diguanylate cyclase (GGDEF)-like protein|nr:diguanylate cyclase [Mycobacteriales bacterium]
MRRYALLAISVIAVVVLGAVAVLTQLDSGGTINRIHRADRTEQQRTLAGLTDQYLSFTFLSTQNAAAASPWRLTPDNASDKAALHALVHSSPLTSYGAALVTLAGMPLTSYPSSAALPPVTDPGLASLRRDLLAGRPGLSDVMHVGQTPLVAFAVPVVRGDHALGLLVTFADVREWPLQGYDAKLHIGKDAQSLVVDRTGTVAAAGGTVQVGSKLTPLPAVVHSGQTGLVSYRSGSRDVVASYGPAGHGWTAVTIQPASAFSGDLDRSHRLAILALAMLLSLVMVLLLVFHHNRQRVLARLAEQRLYDPLTGVGQRALFEIRLQEALARWQRHRQRFAVLYCDVDGFKGINDEFGHNAGDQTLTVIAQRIKDAVRTTDLVVRLGGDEFAVVMECATTAETEQAAQRIRGHIARPITLNGQLLSPAVSVGGALLADGDVSADELLHEADMAMYQAKRDGGCHVVVVGQGTSPSVMQQCEA